MLLFMPSYDLSYTQDGSNLASRPLQSSRGSALANRSIFKNIGPVCESRTPGLICDLEAKF